MFDVNTATIIVILLFGLVLLGVHVAVALGMTSVVGIYLVTGKWRIVEATLASTAAEAMRDFTFAVIPLFMLMGEFIGRSGAITDIYQAINRGVRALPGRLAVATVIGNTIFSFVTGVSIASAAAFSRIAYPEMKSHGYHKGFALGAIAGSSCLGTSVLMIVWGILTEQSIGQLFLAGILPGILLATLYLLYIVGSVIIRPELAGEGVAAENVDPVTTEPHNTAQGQVLFSIFGMVFIIFGVLGGIWFGIFTPTEGAGAGAALALLFAIAKGMRKKQLLDAIFSVGKTAAPILILLLAAALYSRTLAMTGVTSAIQDFFLNSGLSPNAILVLIIIVWFLLGMVIDSISIMLLTVPIFEPLATALGFDRISFAVIGILAIEAGLLTPPFGLLVYTVKSAIQDSTVSVSQIFRSSVPYWIIMLIGIVSIVIFPEIANYLPQLFF